MAGRLAHAEEHCRRQGQAWTTGRRFILQRLLEAGRPLKAYELIAMLQAAGRPSNPATAYQALKGLLAAGLLIRVESLSAFHAVSPQAGPQALLVCRSCRGVTEVGLPEEVRAWLAAQQGDFRPEGWICEVVGTCSACSED
ncbi:hypothetical protein ACFODL_00855 [Phenylobacterium terrae]|uniref:Ferric uptake regulation protein n=1 Tax=Phenylobacterium terrae TaxID=2665495 RepID=A0ABW4MY07_9CAUL